MLDLEYARVDIGVFLITVISRVSIGSLSCGMHVDYPSWYVCCWQMRELRGAGTHDILGSAAWRTTACWQEVTGRHNVSSAMTVSGFSP